MPGVDKKIKIVIVILIIVGLAVILFFPDILNNLLGEGFRRHYNYPYWSRYNYYNYYDYYDYPFYTNYLYYPYPWYYQPCMQTAQGNIICDKRTL
jgi:hypothetical protein